MRSFQSLQGVVVVAFSVALMAGCESANEGTGGGGGTGGTGGAGADCGDGDVDAGEQCDGTDLDGEDCDSLGADYGGTLACTNLCTYNYSGCHFGPFCGDDSADGGEQCDGTDLNNMACTDDGYDGGTLACDSNCKYDTSDCVGTGATCGDGNQEGLEQCDGTDLNNRTCVGLGYVSGTLACASDCSFNTSGCQLPTPPECGNGVAESGEDCDGSDLDGNDCADVGAFGSGTLACTTTCTFNTSGCEAASCDDNAQNQDETDVDCGGDTCGPCVLGDDCEDDDDCEGDLTCSTSDVCANPCEDGYENGTETDVDCGGDDCDGCGAGEDCDDTGDCQMGLSCGIAGYCTDFCSDGYQNNNETDVDCGGTTCCPCRLGEGCGVAADCGGRLSCPAPAYVCADACTDGLLSAGESDVDCGGDQCPLCEIGDDCTDANDCEVGLECPSGTCADECKNGVWDGDETAVDCGGGVCSRCDIGVACGEDSDCFTDNCVGSVCTLRVDPMSVAEVCALYVNRDNFGGDICHAGHHPSVLDWDPNELASACSAGSDGYIWATDLLNSYNVARISIHWDLAHECMARSRYLRATYPNYLLADATQSPGTEWADLINTTDGVCYTFYEPATAEGVACRDAWDCIPPLYCGAATSHSEAVCMVPSAIGESCGTYLECDDSNADPALRAVCDGDVCVQAAANGVECGYDEDCQSGFCYFLDYYTGECRDMPVLKALGEICVSADECAGDCVTCRVTSDGGDEVCALPAGPGDYCRDDVDCIGGLLCQDDACKKLGRGDACYDVYTADGSCGENYICLADSDLIAACWANDGYPEECEAQSLDCGGPSVCVFDYYYGYCDPVAFECMPMPESGPCAGGLVCAAGFYCDDTAGEKGECVPLPEDGEDCVVFDQEAYCAEGHFCNAGTCTLQAGPGQACADVPGSCAGTYACLNDTCTFQCAATAECPGGQICDAMTATCIEPRVQCLSTDECAPGEFCADPVARCTVLPGDTSECEDSPECALLTDLCWNEPYDCSKHGDLADCNAQDACAWDDYYGMCDFDYGLNCGQYEGDASACDAVPGCASFNFCLDTRNYCAYLADNADACTAATECEYTGGDCIEDDQYCWQYDAIGQAACEGDSMCYWDATSGCWNDDVDDCAVFAGNPSGCEAAEYCFSESTCMAAVDACATLDDNPSACGTAPDCTYRTDLCVFNDVSCYDFDGNQSSCLAVGYCTWDGGTGYCDPDPEFTNPDCPQYDGNASGCAAAAGCLIGNRCVETGVGCFTRVNQTECDALLPNCLWDANAAAGAGRCVDKVTECLPKAGTGELCSPALEGEDCESGYCSTDYGTGEYLCEADIGGACNADVEFLRSAFLFGLVFAIGRRGLRWRREKKK